jgi:hypothetical protein
MMAINVLLIILFFVTVIFFANKTALITETVIKREIEEKIVFDSFLTRESVNDKIEKNLYFSSLGFYERLVGDREIAKIIFEKALKKKVPINIAFAISKTESNYNKLALSPHNGDGTVDRGLFQLNSRYFELDWKDPIENTDMALDYLISRYEITGTWEGAVMLYNAGNISNVSSHTFKYLKSVLFQEEIINEKFNDFRRNLNSS